MQYNSIICYNSKNQDYQNDPEERYSNALDHTESNSKKEYRENNTKHHYHAYELH